MLDSASELLRLQTSGEATAVEIAEASIKQIEASQAAMNAYTYVDHEGAIAAAHAVDAKRAAGKPLGPLAGVPVAVKDVLCTKDMPTTCASNMLREFRPPYDATVIERLRTSRRDHRRQDEHGRVRNGRQHRDQCVWHRSQSLG